MNLTSKRMLQFFAGCAGAFALSATAQTTYVADNFEYIGEGQGPTNGVENMPISTYKCQPWGDEGIWQFTNYVWITQSSDDLSKLVTESQNYTGIRPMAGSSTNLVLNLETNGKTLVRTNSAPSYFLTTPVYVDTLIKFTPSEVNPRNEDMDASVKAAVFVNASSNLVVYFRDPANGNVQKMQDTGYFVNPSQWYRLTILLSQVSDMPFFKVYMNGSIITNGTVLDNEWYGVASGETSFNAVAFQGTGMIDEMVVTENTPDFGTPTVTWLTLSFTSDVTVLTNGISVSDGVAVPNNTGIAVIANPWKQITSGGDLLVNATTNKFNDSVITGLVGTVSGSDGQTNTIVSAAYSGTSALPAGFGSADIGKITTWANANGVTPEGLTDAMLDDYLLNVAPATDPKLKITTITRYSDKTTFRIEATDPSVNFTSINGVLNVWASGNLITEPFAALSRSGYFTFTPGTAYIDIDVTGTALYFLKATIDVTAQEE